MVLEVGESAAEADVLVGMGLVDVQAIVDRRADDLAGRRDRGLQAHLCQGMAVTRAGLGPERRLQLDGLADHPVARRRGPGLGAFEQVGDVMDEVAFDQADAIMIEPAELHARSSRR